MKKAVLISFLIILWLPIYQELFDYFKPRPLVGVTISTEKPKFSFNQWWNGNFQKNYDEFFGTTFGLRSFFIRLYNEIEFTLFKKVHGNVLLGKDDVLFEYGYTDELTGKWFDGDEPMKLKIENIRKVGEYLRKKNISLLTVIAPSKADFFREYLPDRFSSVHTDKRFYSATLKYAKEENIPFIDFNKWFLQIKDSSRYPLFPKQGIHWSFYGMALCADSMMKYLEAERKINLTDISWTIELPERLRDTDYDLGDVLNLYQKLPYDQMAYPKFSYSWDSTTTRPRILVAGDSFYWTIYNQGVFNNVFDDQTFYYYSNTIYPQNKVPSNNPNDLNILKEIEKYDIIVLLQSGTNYQNPGVGLIQLISNAMKKHDELLVETRNKIKTSDSLQNISRMISSSKHISKDSADSDLADSIVQKWFDDVSNIKIAMRNNPEWLKQVQDKAATIGTSVENVMQSDAEWMISQQNK